ncbi:NrsF family protein [Szabonella alba]|uniref:DUF1109 domain-containing protein n=1 Tax=Szabonella alba TaxID=2804194 RepID=A0A8K0VBP7_9RHOB|nr:DUF1109 domain-containing protein [Szabonella alba]MBL4916940.1 DUF1109 domain-containing protein [Szabonella alba]
MTPEHRTENLIRDIAVRPLPQPYAPGALLGMVLGLIGLGLALFMGLFGFRPDLASAVTALPVQAKSLLALALAAPAFGLALASARPSAPLRLWPLALPGLVAAALVLQRLLAVPPGMAGAEMMGQTALACLMSITALSALPLMAGLWLMRRGAPTRPGLTGGLLGLAVGAGVAAGYALHCTEDSPLFFVLWYGTGIALAALTGAVLGRLVLRW